MSEARDARPPWRLESVLQAVLGAIFLVGGLLVVLLVNDHDKERALHAARERALLLLGRNLATHEYFARDLKPAVFRLTAGLVEADYFDPTWMSSTYAVRRMDGYSRGDLPGVPTRYYYKEAAIDARSPANEADGMEREFLQAANADARVVEWTGIRELEGRPYYVVMRAGERMEGSCLRCHSTPAAAPRGLVERFGPERSFGRQVGQLVSVLSVRIPLEEAHAAADAFSWRLSLALVAVLAALYAAQFLLHRRMLFRPLRALQAAASGIAGDDRRAGEVVPVPRSRELGGLTAAFNAMSAAVSQGRAGLERTVAERTAELVAANRALEREMRERAEADARLRQSQRMEAVGRLAGGVAHDFNNLLTVINGSAELMLRQLSVADPLREEVEEISAAGGRAAALTQQLLAFSRHDAGQVRVVDAGAVVARLASMLRRLLREDVALDLQPAAGPAPVLADPGRLEQVVVNLVVNARDAMPSGGRLEVAVGEALEEDAEATGAGGRWVRITVRDTGPGMDAETAARVFEPFFSTRPGGAGAGLGMATVHGIVYGLGGRIRVESAPGRGSAFHVLLPRSAGTTPVPAARDEGAPQPASAGTTILLVEDSPPVRRVARRILEGQGYRLLEAADAEEALRLFERLGGEVALVVTDVVMPGLGGPALVERLRASRPGLPALFLSGYTAEVLPTSLPGRLLQKPYRAEELLRSVAEVLAGPRA